MKITLNLLLYYIYKNYIYSILQKKKTDGRFFVSKNEIVQYSFHGTRDTHTRHAHAALTVEFEKYIFIDYTYILLSLCSETCLDIKYIYILYNNIDPNSKDERSIDIDFWLQEGIWLYYNWTYRR